MMKLISRFRKATSGAVTVDFVILTAAVVGLAVSFFLAMDTQTKLLAENTATKITESAAD